MGQEPAFKNGMQAEASPTKEEVEALRKEIERLKNELADAERLNRQLTTKLFSVKKESG